MPRISRTLIAEREKFTNENFSKGMTLDQAQDALVQKYGMKMAPPRLKELFDAADKPASTPLIDAICQVARTGDLSPLTNYVADKTESSTEPPKPFVPTVVKAQAPTYFDRPIPVVTEDGCMPIRELIEAIEKGEVP